MFKTGDRGLQNNLLKNHLGRQKIPTRDFISNKTLNLDICARNHDLHVHNDKQLQLY